MSDDKPKRKRNFIWVIATALLLWGDAHAEVYAFNLDCMSEHLIHNTLMRQDIGIAMSSCSSELKQS